MSLTVNYWPGVIDTSVKTGYEVRADNLLRSLPAGRLPISEWAKYGYSTSNIGLNRWLVAVKVGDEDSAVKKCKESGYFDRASRIYKSTSGTADARTDREETSSEDSSSSTLPSWVIPVVLAGGVFLLMQMKRRR